MMIMDFKMKQQISPEEKMKHNKVLETMNIPLNVKKQLFF